MTDPSPTPEEKSRTQRQVPEGLAKVLEQLDERQHEDLLDVTAELSFTDYRNTLAFDEFMSLASLAILDLTCPTLTWKALEDACGTSRRQIEKYRKTSEYKSLMKRMKKRQKAISKGLSMKEHFDDHKTQDRVSRKMLREAVRSGNLKAIASLHRDIAARAAPAPQAIPEGMGARIVVVQAAQVAELEPARRLLESSKVIDAEVVEEP